MAEPNEADYYVMEISDAALSMESMKRNIEKKAEMEPRLKEAAIANIYEMAGKIKATNFFKTQADFFNILMLKTVKDSHAYRDRFGMTWAKFCEYTGFNVRTVDIHLKSLEPSGNSEYPF